MKLRQKTSLHKSINQIKKHGIHKSVSNEPRPLTIITMNKLQTAPEFSALAIKKDLDSSMKCIQNESRQNHILTFSL